MSKPTQPNRFDSALKGAARRTGADTSFVDLIAIFKSQETGARKTLAPGLLAGEVRKADSPAADFVAFRNASDGVSGERLLFAGASRSAGSRRCIVRRSYGAEQLPGSSSTDYGRVLGAVERRGRYECFSYQRR